MPKNETWPEAFPCTVYDEDGKVINHLSSPGFNQLELATLIILAGMGTRVYPMKEKARDALRQARALFEVLEEDEKNPQP